MAIYAFLGTSRVLSVSTTTTLAILAGTQLGLAVPDGDAPELITAAVTLTALVGVILLLAAVLRLGFVANFISTPVLTGFKAGIGLVIVLDQAPKLLGIHLTKQGFFRDVFSLVQHMPETSLITLAVAVATFVVLTVMELLRPHSPAPLVVVGRSIAVSWYLGLHGRGVATVGLIPQALPSLTLPSLSLAVQLLPGAFGHRPDELHRIDRRRAGLCRPRRSADQCQPGIDRHRRGQSGRRLVRSDAGRRRAPRRPPSFGPRAGDPEGLAGHRRRRGRDHAAARAAPGPFAQATLAAVVIVYSAGLIQPAEFRSILKVRRMEFFWAMVACLGVLVFGTLKGIVVAIVVSLIGLASQAPIRRSMSSAARRGRTCCVRCRRQIPTTRSSRGY